MFAAGLRRAERAESCKLTGTVPVSIAMPSEKDRFGFKGLPVAFLRFPAVEAALRQTHLLPVFRNDLRAPGKTIATRDNQRVLK